MSGGPWWRDGLISPCCGADVHRAGHKNGVEQVRCKGCGRRHTRTAVVRATRNRQSSGKRAAPIKIGRGLIWGNRVGGQLI